jgi:hypothetical protein
MNSVTAIDSARIPEEKIPEKRITDTERLDWLEREAMRLYKNDREKEMVFYQISTIKDKDVLASSLREVIDKAMRKEYGSK